MSDKNPPIIDLAEQSVGNSPESRLALVLMRTWGETEPQSNISQMPASHVATFVDLARAAIEWRDTQVPIGETVRILEEKSLGEALT